LFQIAFQFIPDSLVFVKPENSFRLTLHTPTGRIPPNRFMDELLLPHVSATYVLSQRHRSLFTPALTNHASRLSINVDTTIQLIFPSLPTELQITGLDCFRAEIVLPPLVMPGSKDPMMNRSLMLRLKYLPTRQPDIMRTQPWPAHVAQPSIDNDFHGRFFVLQATLSLALINIAKSCLIALILLISSDLANCHLKSATCPHNLFAIASVEDIILGMEYAILTTIDGRLTYEGINKIG
jgi:hypothetical protein